MAECLKPVLFEVQASKPHLLVYSHVMLLLFVPSVSDSLPYILANAVGELMV